LGGAAANALPCFEQAGGLVTGGFGDIGLHGNGRVASDAALEGAAVTN